MKQFRVYFRCSFFSNTPDTFVDNDEVTFELKAPAIETVEEIAAQVLMEELAAQKMVVRAIELLKIKDIETGEYKTYTQEQ